MPAVSPDCGLSLRARRRRPDPDMIYNIGLCDENEKAKIQQYCDTSVNLIKQGATLAAVNVWDEFLNGDVVRPYGAARIQPFTLPLTPRAPRR